ncbi:unnamed protein product, partial [Staurois parvus]
MVSPPLLLTDLPCMTTGLAPDPASSLALLLTIACYVWETSAQFILLVICITYNAASSSSLPLS